MTLKEKLLSISLLLLIILFSSCGKKNEKETILTIFAHPDDETTIGPVLAKYAAAHEVYLVFATGGRFGVTEHAGIPAGDSLVGVRKLEAECSCSSLGINSPIFLDAQDGLGLNGHGNFYEQVPKLKEGILETIKRIKPTKILTYGPDGDTGHPDHRLIGGITTEMLLREGLMDEIDLYYFGWTKEQAEKYAWWDLAYVGKKALNTAIAFDEADEAKAIKSIECYVSQYTKAEIDRWIKAEEDDPYNVLYFRKFSLEDRKMTDF